jgi:hypothetical protein
MSANGVVNVNVTTADNVDVTLSVMCYNTGTVGVIINSAGTTSTTGSTPFFPLGQHRGIKRINWITNATSVGGFYCAVLVKPLTTFLIREVNTMTEHCLISQKTSLPRIYDGAYLNFLLFAVNTGNPATLRGQFDFVWSD